MQAFALFLKREGHLYTGNHEYFAYFALPHITDPKLHPVFSIMFENAWRTHLLERVNNSVGEGGVSGLMDYIYSQKKAGQSLPTSHSQDVFNEVNDLKNERDHLAMKLQSIQTGYHQVITVAAELVQTLANSIRGEKITPTYLSGIVTRLSSLRKNPPALINNHVAAEKSTILKSVIPPVIKPVLKLADMLDYNKIKQDLMLNPQNTEGIRQQAFLIQALGLVFKLLQLDTVEFVDSR